MIPSPSLAAAFLAGVVTFLAPCTLPLVPAYLGFLSGTSASDLKTHRGRVLGRALLFVLGFSVVLVTLGSLAGFLGATAASAAAARSVIQRAGGAVVIFLGLSMLGVFRIPLLQRRFGIRLNALARVPAGLRAFLFGAVLASGWTPCVGPILGTMLFLAGSTATAGTGAFLLAVYAAGLALPFLLVALFASRAVALLARLAPLARGVEVVAGLFLIFVGGLFLVDRLGVFIGASYRALDFIDYDALYRFF